MAIAKKQSSVRRCTFCNRYIKMVRIGAHHGNYAFRFLNHQINGTSCRGSSLIIKPK